MSISSIASSPNVPQWQTLLQRRDDFSQLAQALQAGDLGGAKRAFADLQSLQQNSRLIGAPIQNDLGALGQSLQSNNLAQAQSNFAQLQNEVKTSLRHHPHRHQAESSSASSHPSSESSGTGEIVNVLA